MKNNLIALNENELNEVTGGVNLKEIRNTAIIAACATIGSVVGDTLSSSCTLYINRKTGHSKIIEVQNQKMVKMDNICLGTVLVSKAVGLTAGAAAGAAVGKTIVNFLNRK